MWLPTPFGSLKSWRAAPSFLNRRIRTNASQKRRYALCFKLLNGVGSHSGRYFFPFSYTIRSSLITAWPRSKSSPYLLVPSFSSDCSTSSTRTPS